MKLSLIKIFVYNALDTFFDKFYFLACITFLHYCLCIMNFPPHIPDAFRTILREEGWSALYRGIVPSLFLVLICPLYGAAVFYFKWSVRICLRAFFSVLHIFSGFYWWYYDLFNILHMFYSFYWWHCYSIR